MSDDPRCPECGGPIGQTATYCMHCSADLTDELAAADADGDWTWDVVETEAEEARQGPDAPESGAGAERGGATAATAAEPATGDRGDEPALDPDGLVDDSLTVVVGILAGIVVGLVGTFVLAVLTGSAWALLFGAVAWLGATAYLVRRRTVQEAVAKGGYALAAVLLAVPAVALSPVADVDGGVGARGGLLVALLAFVAVPAAIAAGIGWFASRYVPADERNSEG